jgi:arylamine N-acetyltransferase
MNNPNAHLVQVVLLEGREYLIDVGYAAPFLSPMPLDLDETQEFVAWDDRYVLYPKDEHDRSTMELYRGGQLKHHYTVTPRPQRISDFEKSIARSFSRDSTFLNSLLLARYSPSRSIRIVNNSRYDTARSGKEPAIIHGRNELAEAVEEHFGISAKLTLKATDGLELTGDAWS